MNSALANTFPLYWVALMVLGGRIQVPLGVIIIIIIIVLIAKLYMLKYQPAR